jgi:hypothetical protein
MERKPTTPNATTPARSEAARRNGSKSRGPITEAGKNRAAQNAIQHGMYARSIVLPGESQEDYDLLRDQYLVEFSPSGPVENHEVETLINAEWRIRRFRDMETEVIETGMLRRHKQDEGALISYNYVMDLDHSTGIKCVYQFEPRLQRDYDRALRRLLDFRKKRRNEPKPQDNNAPSTLLPNDIGYHQNVGAEPCPSPEAPVCLYTSTPHLESIAGWKMNSTNSICTIGKPSTKPGNIVLRKTATPAMATLVSASRTATATAWQ